MRCVSNHTACRFAEKTRFFRSLRAGRRCVAASRFLFFKDTTLITRRRGTAMRALSRAFPFPVILLNKARWGRGGGQGEGTPPLARAEGVPLPLNLTHPVVSKIKSSRRTASRLVAQARKTDRKRRPFSVSPALHDTGKPRRRKKFFLSRLRNIQFHLHRIAIITGNDAQLLKFIYGTENIL